MIPVYVPAAGKLAVIDRGSGIVGTEREGDVLVDYEGNRYRAVNLRTFADRVARAHDRHATRYPTVARMAVHASALVQVGWYDPGEGVAVFRGTEYGLLAEWLGVETIDPHELHVTN